MTGGKKGFKSLLDLSVTRAQNTLKRSENERDEGEGVNLGRKKTASRVTAPNACDDLNCVKVGST